MFSKSGRSTSENNPSTHSGEYEWASAWLKQFCPCLASRCLLSFFLKKEITLGKRTNSRRMVFTRLFASVAAVGLGALGLLALLPDCASACSCAMAGSQQERVKQALSDSEAVFSGKVVDFEKPAPPTTEMEGTLFTIMGGGAATVPFGSPRCGRGQEEEVRWR
jgi:hypothetical protein